MELPPMPPALRRALFALLLATPVFAASAHAAQVSNLTALVRNGQTYLTWDCPPGTGWIYRVYRSPSPIGVASDLNLPTCDAAIEDSTWYDHRLSTLTVTTYGYCINSCSPELTTV